MLICNMYDLFCGLFNECDDLFIFQISDLRPVPLLDWVFCTQHEETGRMLIGYFTMLICNMYDLFVICSRQFQQPMDIRNATQFGRFGRVLRKWSFVGIIIPNQRVNLKVVLRLMSNRLSQRMFCWVTIGVWKVLRRILMEQRQKLMGLTQSCQKQRNLEDNGGELNTNILHIYKSSIFIRLGKFKFIQIIKIEKKTHTKSKRTRL